MAENATVTGNPQNTGDHDHQDPTGSPAGSQVARLIAILEALAKELHPERAGRLQVHHDSSLERDLGIDSLARVELLLRLEQGFGVRLSEETLMTAETPADLLAALRAASPATAEEPAWAPVEAPAAASAPDQAVTLLDVLTFHKEAHGERPHIHLIEIGRAHV